MKTACLADLLLCCGEGGGFKRQFLALGSPLHENSDARVRRGG